MRTLAGCLIVALAVPVAAAPPRIAKRLKYDAIYETRLGGALYDGPYSVLSTLKLRLLTRGGCSNPSCSSEGQSTYSVKIRCREMTDGLDSYCPGSTGTGPLELLPSTSMDPNDVSVRIGMNLTFETGATCHFEGVDPFAYPIRGYFFAVSGTFACTDANGAVGRTGTFRMGMDFPPVSEGDFPRVPRRPGEL